MKRNKYCMYPVERKNLWDFYKKHEASIWQAEKIDYSADISDIKKLTKDEFFYLTRVLAFFAQSDGIVNENLAARFYNDVDLPEARAFYSIQMYQESVHSETYSLLIDSYVKEDAEKEKLFNAIETVPLVKKKAQWALKWIESQEDFVKRLIAFAVVEGIFFSGSFCAIYWFRKRGLLVNGLSVANDYISRDEYLHYSFSAALYKELDLKISEKDFNKIVKEAVEIEKEFVTDALPVKLIGMNSELMCQYIEHVTDNLCTMFGFPKIFNSLNPFDFMKLINLDSQKNFFEKRVSEYKKNTDKNVSFNEDF